MGDEPPSLEVRSTATGVILPVRLTPRSARDEISGVEIFGGEAMLKVRVRALPADGRANAALTKLIAKWLGVAPSCVKIVHGGKSRAKQVAIDGDGVALSALIATRLAALKPER